MLVVRRTASIAVATVAAVLGVASATSLGTFEQPTLSAAAGPVDHCEATVELLDGSLGSLPLLGGLLSAFTIDFAEFTDVDSACDGEVPTIVVLGYPPLSVDEQVLVTIDVAPLSAGGGLTQLLDVLDVTLPVGTYVTEVQVAYSPY